MMWRWSCIFLKQSLSLGVRYKPKAKAALGLRAVCALFSTESGGGGSGSDVVGGGGDNNNNNNSSMSFAEAKKLMRLVNVEALKMKLEGEEKEVICYSELLQACESMGVAKSRHEAATFARVLDEAGVVLHFRDKVYLHPDKRNLKVAVRISQATSFSVKFHTIMRDALKASFTEPEPTTTLHI